MKNKSTLLTAALVALITFAAAALGTHPEELAGTWIGKEMTVNGEAERTDSELKLVLHADGKLQVFQDGEEEESGTWEVDDDNKLLFKDESGAPPADWEVDGNKLTLTMVEALGEKKTVIQITLEKEGSEEKEVEEKEDEKEGS